MGIKEELGGEEHLRWSDMNNMPYTNKVMNETLRRATILPWYSRKAAQDFTIDGNYHLCVRPAFPTTHRLLSFPTYVS